VSWVGGVLGVLITRPLWPSITEPLEGTTYCYYYYCYYYYYYYYFVYYYYYYYYYYHTTITTTTTTTQRLGAGGLEG